MSRGSTRGTGRPPHDAGVLLVDDMEDNLVALEAVLSTLHVPLARAASGAEAVTVLEREEIALVLLDVAMPGMDGFETARCLKRSDHTKDLPVIFLTGPSATRESGFSFRGYATGTVDYVPKPFDPWVLRTKVSVFLDLDRKSRRLCHLLTEEQHRLDDFARRLEAVETRLADGGADTARLARDVAQLADTLNGLRGV
ncbi:response regulator [Streptomyces reniochalinae]|uniref:Response regulator n=1 Tax=Streptomyces reniochalinae TaxID=2250578 RepID=A0A367E9H7_9ACTN|nr:response regulator [Streptomyces reniochalinae]RCG14706.1 response regulator [Streptomyces reniochalinae]